MPNSSLRRRLLSPSLVQDRLGAAVDALEQGVGQRVHLGAQIYVSVDGRALVDTAVGEVVPGVALDVESGMPWLSATSLLTTIAVMQLWESGDIGLDEPVARRWPEFGCNGKGHITARHLLKHIAGLDPAIDSGLDWPDLVERTGSCDIEPGWIHRGIARSGPVNTWALGGLVEHVTSTPLREWLHEYVLEPAGADLVHLGGEPADLDRLSSRWSPVYDTTSALPRRLETFDSENTAARFEPAGGGRGPARALGHVYETLLQALAGERRDYLRPTTVEAMTSPRRTGVVDLTFGASVPWGLGVAVTQGHPPHEPMPFGLGRFASSRAFGHHGFQTTHASADPEHGLVVVVSFNGLPGATAHERRTARVVDAVHDAIGASTP